MSTLAPVTDATFDSLVLASPKPVLVDYWADWCSPCKQMTPILEELSERYGSITFLAMDTNENTEVPTKQGVLGLPTIQIFVNGDVVQSFQGGRTKMALTKILDEFA